MASIGKNVVIAKPAPKNENVRRRLSNQKRRDTKPELELRSELHGRGLRYRVDWRPPLPGFRSRIDVAFPRQRVAVFIDGCFWHGCPVHATKPKNNADWWERKIGANLERDLRNRQLLSDDRWLVERVWEHESPAAAAARIEQVVHARR